MTRELERLYIEARNNYEQDLSRLFITERRLRNEGENKKADYVYYIMQDLKEEKLFTETYHPDGYSYVSVGQIKRDYIDYEGEKGSEEKVYYEDDKSKYSVMCIFERGYIVIMVNMLRDGKDMFSAEKFIWEDFKLLSQKGFESLINSIIFYTAEDDEETGVA